MGKVKKKILHVTTDLTTDLTSKSSPLLKHVRVLSVSGVALAQVWCSGVMGPHRGTGGHIPQCLSEADVGPPPRPRPPLHR